MVVLLWDTGSMVMMAFAFPAAILQPALIGLLLCLISMLTVTVMIFVPSMAPVHEEMQKGTRQQNQKRQKLPDMLSMLDQQKVRDRTNQTQGSQAFRCEPE